MEASAKEVAKPRRLGRGLSSLIGLQAPAHPVAVDSVGSNQSSILSDVQSIPIDAIDPSPFQPRRVVDESSLVRLAESIGRTGMLQPIVVRPMRRGDGTERYELVAGERRWRAARLAAQTRIPAVIKPLSDEDAAACSLVENVQREDLNPMDRAFALRSLSERFGLSHEQLAERVGLERPTVANLIRLTELEPDIAKLISSGKLSAGHGKALLAIAAGDERVSVANMAAQMGWSVRRVEQLSQRRSPSVGGVSGEVSPRWAVLRDLERQIGQHLGTKVLIATDRKGKRGRMSIEFYGLDHFDGLLARLGIPTK